MSSVCQWYSVYILISIFFKPAVFTKNIINKCFLWSLIFFIFNCIIYNVTGRADPPYMQNTQGLPKHQGAPLLSQICSTPLSTQFCSTPCRHSFAPPPCRQFCSTPLLTQFCSTPLLTQFCSTPCRHSFAPPPCWHSFAPPPVDTVLRRAPRSLGSALVTGSKIICDYHVNILCIFSTSLAMRKVGCVSGI